MSVKPVRIYGDPCLRQRAAEVAAFDTSLGRLVDDLIDTLRDARGAGIAAPQIGIGLRAFVYFVNDPEDPDRGEIRHIVNPVLGEASDDLVGDIEGCLSIPRLECELPRPRRVVARGFDREGAPVEVVGTDRLARCLAHETDHLDGVLFIDRLDPDERKKAMRYIRELILAGEDVTPIRRSPHAGLL